MLASFDPAPEFLRVRPSAEFLGIGRTKLYDLANEGRLHPCKIDGRTVFAVRELRAFVAEVAMSAGVDAALYIEPEPIEVASCTSTTTTC